MKRKTPLLIVAKDDFPLEQIINRPVTNFFRRLLLSSHKECHKCYEERNGIKVTTNLK